MKHLIWLLIAIHTASSASLLPPNANVGPTPRPMYYGGPNNTFFNVGVGFNNRPPYMYGGGMGLGMGMGGMGMMPGMMGMGGMGMMPGMMGMGGMGMMPGMMGMGGMGMNPGMMGMGGMGMNPGMMGMGGMGMNPGMGYNNFATNNGYNNNYGRNSSYNSARANNGYNNNNYYPNSSSYNNGYSSSNTNYDNSYRAPVRRASDTRDSSQREEIVSASTNDSGGDRVASTDQDYQTASTTTTRRDRRGVSEPRSARKTRGFSVIPHSGAERSAQRAPIWNSFINNFKRCAPGCEPTGYAAFGHRDHVSCHTQGKAIDVAGMNCEGQHYRAIDRGRYAKMVSCMKKRMKVLYFNGPQKTLGHRDHAHFSNGCYGGRYW